MSCLALKNIRSNVSKLGDQERNSSRAETFSALLIGRVSFIDENARQSRERKRSSGKNGIEKTKKEERRGEKDMQKEKEKETKKKDEEKKLKGFECGKGI